MMTGGADGPGSKTRLALGLLDRPAAQGLAVAVPVIVADAGYGRSVAFRLALEERGWSYVMAVDSKEIARPATAEPYQPVYGGLGPPTLPRYREAPRPLIRFVDADTSFGRSRADRLLDDQPARHHPGRRSGAVGEDALAHRARLPRTQARSGPGPLRGPHLARPAPPRHPRHRRPGLPHPQAARPQSPDVGLTLYQVLDALRRREPASLDGDAGHPGSRGAGRRGLGRQRSA